MIREEIKFILPKHANIAYQGENGAYSELAIINYIDNGTPLPKTAFEGIFEALLDKSAQYGMIPVRNSLAGEVEGVEVLLNQYNPNIIHKIQVAIEHCLIVNPGVTQVNSVYSHIQALKQCNKYIMKNKLIQFSYYDTAGAVKMIKENNLVDAGAIASKLAAEVYGMDILDSNLGSDDNITTFYLIHLET